MLFVNIACILYKISPLIKYYAKGVMQKGGQTPRWLGQATGELEP